ncbi:VIT1/CCC1 transporter family protein [Cellulomonas hominis]|uniref:VIT1/CCC1 transporter family protein n=1 Tax=Cellulomonas hominis TaxID=156981 RepID=UPI001C0FC64F|nr:VIT1/CCC1 transporter family protein [Cellulomonas hominis]MBU5423608.1 VIT1/CCC1 transporter family protein [Cellulomonas hominis]
MSALSTHLLDRDRTVEPRRTEGRTDAARPGAGAPAAPDVPHVPDRTVDLPTAGRLNWLRAGVLGANDGIVSVAATVVGVAGAATEVTTLAVAGVAALVAGALSMAAGEYVSVSSQRDAEKVLRAHGALDADAELTNPWHAALASLLAFVVGGVVPLLVVLAPWGGGRIVATFAAVVLALVVTGSVSARLGGARPARAVLRNVVGGSLAMVVTYGIGSLVGLAV